MKGDILDPRALIQEAYKIEGITESECRSIFLDWALGVAAGRNTKEDVAALLEKHGAEPADHPMTLTLKAALGDAKPARRRGGRAARFKD